MKMKYKMISYITYGSCIFYLFIVLKNMSYEQLDLSYQTKSLVYLIFSSSLIIFLLFQFQKYENYLKKQAYVLVIRFHSINQIYKIFVLDIIKDTFILTIIMILGHIIVLNKISISTIILYFYIHLFILFIHFILEITINAKISLVFTFIYYLSSLSIGDILVELHYQQAIYLFVPNMLMTSRNLNTDISLLILMISIIGMYYLGKKIMKYKDIK